MRNYLFYPFQDSNLDDVPPLSVNTTENITHSTSVSTQTSPDRCPKRNIYTGIYNIPFFNSLLFPNIFGGDTSGNDTSGVDTSSNETSPVETTPVETSPVETSPVETTKILFYYQTFSSLDSIINLKLKTDSDIYVYISSVHFGILNKEPYIGINDNPTNKQGSLWDDALKAHENNVNIMLMIGGAGGAYTALFSNFEVYYNLLYELLNEKRYIKGVDLDIEESIKLDDIKMLIRRLKKDFGDDFIITLAPVASSVMYDMPSMGGFIYKDLNSSPEGGLISWYNVQCYEECSFEIYNSMVNNGYTPSKIVIGMLGDSFDSLSFIPVMEEINKIKTKYPNMAGCILWEYGDTHINPIEWGINI